MPRVCKKGTRASDSDGFVKLSSRVVASDAGKWKMNVFNVHLNGHFQPETRQQVNLPIQVKIGNGQGASSVLDKPPHTLWTADCNASDDAVGQPGVPVYYQLVRE
ncbi:hypothetical protein B0H13DRAFT_1854330 [Mycena leptocephala]|nr:hypothetical protein B0H13DRAFT_1854330 [Mycena leptocephala]